MFSFSYVTTKRKWKSLFWIRTSPAHSFSLRRELEFRLGCEINMLLPASHKTGIALFGQDVADAISNARKPGRSLSE